MSFTLRDYQRRSINSFYSYCETNSGNPLIVAPTGSGKSLIIAQLCREILGELPAARIIVATHIRELIKQDYDELLELWPEAPAGIYSAGMNRRDKDAQILFAGVQSVWKPERIEEIGTFDLMIVDEAHLVSHDKGTTYRLLIDGLRIARPTMRVLGLTATAFRMSTGRLDRGEDKLFDDIIDETNLRDLIDSGFLCKLISKATLTKLDVKGVGKRGGEFIASELEIAVNQDWITRGAVDEMVNLGADRKSWLVFCTGVNHAKCVGEEIASRGISCGVILGDTPKEERDHMIEQFKSGELRCLVSVMVIATGFNAKNCDMIALLRPTQSAGLFAQQVGRGLRKIDGKEKNCLVLDFAGNTRRHGPVDTITADGMTRMTRGDDEASESDETVKAKVCPECRSYAAPAVMKCINCGYEWPKPVPKHAAVADSTLDIISSGKPEWVQVDSMSFALHRKYGQPDIPPSLCLEYKCGLMSYREWLALQKPGGARWWAEKKWRDMGGYSPVPITAAQAIERIDELRVPESIMVKRNGRYFEITGRRYSHDGWMKSG